MLRRGVSEANFERFVTEEYYAMAQLPGEEGYLLKGGEAIEWTGVLLPIAYDYVQSPMTCSSGSTRFQ